MQPAVCRCRCHCDAKADQRDALDDDRPMDAYDYAQQAALWEFKGQGAAVHDVIEAAAACPDCLNDHCPALLGRVPRGPRIVRIRPPFNPQSDSQTVTPDEGEGAE